MFRFFADQENISADKIKITGADVNHIRNVLRMKMGEQALISNRVDRDYLCEVEEPEGEAVIFKILREMEEGTELPARIWLFQGLPKGDKMELIIQKAVELGVYGIVPVAMKRSVVRLDAKKEETRLKRWNAIAESAAKQSKRIIIPQVGHVLEMKEAVSRIREFDLKLLPYECAKGMDESRRIVGKAKAGMEIGIMVGPEGGFDEAEVDLAREAGVDVVSLGKRILRTETAGICLLSVVMFGLDG